MTASLSDKKQNPGIAISSLIRAFHCSRQYYFYKECEGISSSRYTICKMVSCAYPEDRSEEMIWDSICLIHPDISPDERSFLSSCLLAMKKTPIRHWTETDNVVKSIKLDLYGLLDKFDAKTSECTLTRCTTSPKNGCWPEDRIRIAALLICIEETCDINPKGMYIEYIPSGIIRYYEPTPKDRRQIIQILHQIHTIEKGEFPPKPLHPPCSRCKYEKLCIEHEPRRLSALFKK